MRILVVEDDAKIASFVLKGLRENLYAVDVCGDGEEALLLASTTPYDAAVVDLMLPRLDGLSLIQRLRAKGLRLPILILSAKASVDDRVKGLQSGGDEYLTKPFAFSELLARVQALIRRASQTTEPTRLTVSVFSAGGRAEKVAVTLRAMFIGTVQAPVPEHAPLQLVKTEPCAGVAVRVTLLPPK